MSRERCRSIGAVIGLAIGIGLMYFVFAMQGVLPGAIFGAGGALLGGITGERVHLIRNRK